MLLNEVKAKGKFSGGKMKNATKGTSSLCGV